MKREKLLMGDVARVRPSTASRTSAARSPIWVECPTWKPGARFDAAAADLPALLARAPHRSVRYHATKRTLDVIAATAALIIAAPFILIISILIRLDSRGPAFFRQRRLGIGLQEFSFIKFRTMHVNAAEKNANLYRYDFDVQAARRLRFKEADDPRLTRMGRIIRRTSLDELPNLFSVLRGDISLVGPRPEIPEMLPYYRPEEICKFAVKPGVTGLAQVSGRNILMWGETNARDIEYVNRRSTRFDLWLLVRTVAAVVGMVGAL